MAGWLAAFGEELEATWLGAVGHSSSSSPGSATNLLCDLWQIATNSGPQLLHLQMERLDQTSDFQTTSGAPSSPSSISRKAVERRKEAEGVAFQPLPCPQLHAEPLAFMFPVLAASWVRGPKSAKPETQALWSLKSSEKR